jgi:hypothetical protein
MRAAVENIGCESSDSEFESEKWQVTVRKQPRHERVSFGGDIQVQPKQRELGIEPVEAKQQ